MLNLLVFEIQLFAFKLPKLPRVKLAALPHQNPAIFILLLYRDIASNFTRPASYILRDN